MNIEKDFYAWTFWFSDQPENKVFWYIKKNNNGEYKLILEQSFEKRRSYIAKIETNWNDQTDRIINWDIIEENDLISNTKAVSLCGVSFHDFWPPIKEYDFIYMIFEYYFDTKENICFDSVKFSFNGLLEFIGKGSFNIEKIINENIIQTNIICDRNNLFTLEKKIKEFKLKFIVEYKQKFLNSNFDINNKHYSLLKGVDSKSSAYIHIEYNKEKHIDDIIKLLNSLFQFFSLNFQDIIKLEDVELYRKEIIQEKERNYTPHIIFNRWFLKKNQNIKNKEEKNMLLSLNDIKDNIKNIIWNWIEDENKKRIYNIYFNVLWNKSLNLENQFLNIIQAIEGLSDIIFPQIQSLTNKEKNSIKKSIKKCVEITEEQRKYIQIFSNTVTLEEKLNKILDTLWIKINDIHDNISLKDIIKLRNDLSHWNEIEDNFYKIYAYTKICTAILELFILKELWISDNIYNNIKDYKITTLKIIKLK